ncbi:hypothetical protein [Qipengyuania sp.]|jgi:hypothetical protein|uniref:hypothetical protein n=1 Tax=Qipengyuania sp. TaxID=2004515 RepID=UPI003735083B
MHDYFWSLEGRRDWYEQDPQRFTTLAKFFLDYGRLRYGAAWDGNFGKPSEKTAKPLREDIAQRAAGGQLKTVVLNPKTFKFVEVGPEHWRNEAAFRAIFSRCQLDPSDPAKVSSDGSHHGKVFVTNESAKAVLSTVGLSSSSDSSSIISTDYFSTYLRFLIHLAQTKQSDLDGAPAKSVRGIIADEWEVWKQNEPALQGGGPLGELSDRLITGMAVLLRGESARIARIAGARKNGGTN